MQIVCPMCERVLKRHASRDAHAVQGQPVKLVFFTLPFECTGPHDTLRAYTCKYTPAFLARKLKLYTQLTAAIL